MVAVVALLSISTTTIASAQSISPSTKWTGAAFSGSDGFLGFVTAAYRNGSTASLFVVVNNEPFTGPNGCICPMNVSAVKVVMDWGTNYSSTSPVPSVSSPVQLVPLQSMGFTITFTVDMKVASNIVLHSYLIQVDQVRSPHFGPGPAPIFLFGSGFAVLSPDQAAALDLDNSLRFYGLQDGINFAFRFSSPQAQVLAASAALNFTRGDDRYDRGDFSGAKSYLGSASNSLSRAMSAETSFQNSRVQSGLSQIQSGLAVNNSTITTNKSTADLNNARMGSENIRAWGFLLAGLGVVVAGAAGVIYAIKRPAHSMSTTASHSSGQ